MATNTRWATPTAVQTLMQTALDGLASNALVVSSETSGNMTSGAYDNTAALDLYADVELAVCYATAPSAGARVAELYVLPSADGTNYPSLDGSNQPQKALLVAVFESRNPSTAAVERLLVPGVTLPPGKFKFVLKNASGQALKDNTVTKTLKMRPYQLQNG